MENEFLFESTILRKGKKKMKKIYNTLFSLGIVAMIFSSCSDWLDVRPSDEFNDDFFFATGMGFGTGLIGIYGTLASHDLYAKILCWVLSMHWAGCIIWMEYQVLEEVMLYNKYRRVLSKI